MDVDEYIITYGNVIRSAEDDTCLGARVKDIILHDQYVSAFQSTGPHIPGFSITSDNFHLLH